MRLADRRAGEPAWREPAPGIEREFRPMLRRRRVAVIQLASSDVLVPAEWMDAAEQFPLETTEPLPWVEICMRYPGQYVCLVDIDHAELRSPEINTAPPPPPATGRFLGYQESADTVCRI